MKRELIVYYITRLLISAVFALLVYLSGWPLWACILTGSPMFILFLYYAHSGHYLVDPDHPFTPLRRDARGQAIRDRSLVWAVVIAGLLYTAIQLLGLFIETGVQLRTLVLPAAILVYFTMTWVLFRRGIQ